MNLSYASEFSLAKKSHTLLHMQAHIEIKHVFDLITGFILHIFSFFVTVSQVYTSHGPTVIMPTWFCSRSWFLEVGPFDEGGKVNVHTEIIPNVFSLL